MKLEQGIYPDLPREEYDAIPAMRFSQIKNMAKSPLLYRFRLDNPVEQTPPMKLGNAVHLAILEPSLADFAIWPGPGRRFGKVFDAWCEANAGKTLLNEKEQKAIVGASIAVNANPTAHKYLREGFREVSLVWFDTTWNRWFKARPDNTFADAEGQILVSLKTTSDCSEKWFARQYLDMQYLAQDAIYQSGWHHLTGKLPRMVTVAVEMNAPHESVVYTIDNTWLNEGQAAVTRWVQRLNECERTNVWPVAYPEERELEFPGWAVTLNDDFAMDDLAPLED